MVYHLVNTLNNRTYVGKTDNPTRRLSQHRRNPPARLRSDLLAVGKTFDDIVLFAIAHECATLRAASHFEQLDIARLDTRSRSKGYNTLRGGSVQTDPQYRYFRSHDIV